MSMLPPNNHTHLNNNNHSNESLQQELEEMPMEDFETLLQQASTDTRSPAHPKHAELIKKLQHGTSPCESESGGSSLTKCHSSLQSLTNNDNNNEASANNNPPEYIHRISEGYGKTLPTIKSTSSLNSLEDNPQGRKANLTYIRTPKDADYPITSERAPFGFAVPSGESPNCNIPMRSEWPSVRGITSSVEVKDNAAASAAVSVKPVQDLFSANNSNQQFPFGQPQQSSSFTISKGSESSDKVKRASAVKNKNSKIDRKETLVEPEKMEGYIGKYDVDDIVKLIDGDSSHSAKGSSKISKGSGRKERGVAGPSKDNLVKSASFDENHLNSNARKRSQSSSVERKSKRGEGVQLRQKSSSPNRSSQTKRSSPVRNRETRKIERDKAEPKISSTAEDKATEELIFKLQSGEEPKPDEPFVTVPSRKKRGKKSAAEAGSESSELPKTTVPNNFPFDLHPPTNVTSSAMSRKPPLPEQGSNTAPNVQPSVPTSVASTSRETTPGVTTTKSSEGTQGFSLNYATVTANCTPTVQSTDEEMSKSKPVVSSVTCEVGKQPFSSKGRSIPSKATISSATRLPAVTLPTRSQPPVSTQTSKSSEESDSGVQEVSVELKEKLQVQEDKEEEDISLVDLGPEPVLFEDGSSFNFDFGFGTNRKEQDGTERSEKNSEMVVENGESEGMDEDPSSSSSATASTNFDHSSPPPANGRRGGRLFVNSNIASSMGRRSSVPQPSGYNSGYRGRGGNPGTHRGRGARMPFTRATSVVPPQQSQQTPLLQSYQPLSLSNYRLPHPIPQSYFELQQNQSTLVTTSAPPLIPPGWNYSQIPSVSTSYPSPIMMPFPSPQGAGVSYQQSSGPVINPSLLAAHMHQGQGEAPISPYQYVSQQQQQQQQPQEQPSPTYQFNSLPHAEQQHMTTSYQLAHQGHAAEPPIMPSYQPQPQQHQYNNPKTPAVEHQQLPSSSQAEPSTTTQQTQVSQPHQGEHLSTTNRQPSPPQPQSETKGPVVGYLPDGTRGYQPREGFFYFMPPRTCSVPHPTETDNFMKQRFLELMNKIEAGQAQAYKIE